MTEKWEIIAKLLLNYGGMGLCVWLLFRLIDKWAEKFLEAHMEQAKATATQAAAVTQLARVVTDGQENGREVLMAVRLLADRIDRQHNYLIRLDERIEKDLRRTT